jgi:WD40 repeat protein
LLNTCIATFMKRAFDPCLKPTATVLSFFGYCSLAPMVIAAPSIVLPTSPILRLENDSHSDLVTALSADSACRYAATASLDKTVRVWEAATGKALMVLRPPITGGDEGKLFAVAISPDGATVACGGATDYGDGASVFLFDRATGRIARKIAGPHGVVHALAFSRDGKYLAVGTDDDGGLSVYRSADGHLAGEDDGKHGAINSIQFAAPDNDGAPVRLAESSTEGVHLYKFLETAATLLREVAQADRRDVPHGSTPGRIAFSPDGKQIALGFTDEPCVLILTGDDLTPGEIYRVPLLDSGDGTNNLMSVCWSIAGPQVFGAGDAGDKADESTIYRWTLGRKDSPTKMAAGALQVTGMLCHPQGGLLFSAAALPLGSFDSNGHRSLFHAFPLTRSPKDGSLLVSADGSAVAFPSWPTGRIVRFSLRDHALQVDGPNTASLQSPVTDRPGVAIRNGDDRNGPTLNGVDIPLEPFETIDCKAIAPDEQSFVLGTSHTLQCFNQDLAQLWSRTLPSPAWKVNISGQNKVAVAALGDGTIRWYRMTDGAELCAFYPDDDLKRWVAWTPSYDYDVSPGGEDLFGWHMNHGLDQAADFYPGLRFHDAHFKPRQLAMVLDEPPVKAASGAVSPDASPVPSSVTSKSLTVGDAERILHHVDLQIALVKAITAGDARAAKKLLASGASPNDTNNAGSTLLTIAAVHSNTTLVALLLQAGAKVNAREVNAISHTHDMTTLMYVAITGNIATAKLLLKAGADVNARDSDNHTPLVYAVESGAGPDIIRLLTKAGGHR